MTKRVNPEVILPRQEAVSTAIARVHEFVEQDKPLVALIAMDGLLKAGRKIDYAAIGQADNDSYDSTQSAEEAVFRLGHERNTKRAWVALQDGAGASPQLLKKLTSTLRRIDRIDDREIPVAENALHKAVLNNEEISSLAEDTGEAWPYYPDLMKQSETLAAQHEPTSEADDGPIRQSIHNIISRLSKDDSLGVLYAKFTTHLFTHVSAEEKSQIAKALATMTSDGDVEMWKESGSMYIRSTLQASAETLTEARHLIVVEMDLDDEITHKMIADIHKQLGSEAYRRIESDSKLELQVPRAFAQAFADRNGLMLTRRGPSSYRLS